MIKTIKEMPLTVKLSIMFLLMLYVVSLIWLTHITIGFTILFLAFRSVLRVMEYCADENYRNLK